MKAASPQAREGSAMRGGRSRILSCLLVALATAPTFAAPPTPSGAPTVGATTTGYDAVAMAPGAPGTRVRSAPQPNKLLAATSALQRCSAQRQPDAPACELLSLGAQTLRTAAALRGAAGKAPRNLFLWQVESPTAKVYLAGSIHMLKPTLYPLNATFQRSFEEADTLVLEIDPRKLDPATASQAMFSRGLLPATQTLSAQLSGQGQKLLSERAREYGIDSTLLERFSPMLATQTLTVTSMAALGYPSQSGVEQYFLDQLGARRVLELETVNQQLDLLFSAPLPVQVEMLEATLTQLDTLEAWLEAMVIAWLSGDTENLEQLVTEQTGSSAGAIAFGKRLLDERNRAMAAKISTFLRGKGTYFVLVGAAHYPGTEGILALLAKEGHVPRQLTADAPR